MTPSRHKLRIAVLVTQFPKISETFILAQILSLLDAGYEIRIFPKIREHDLLDNPRVEENRLLEKTIYPPEAPSDSISGVRRIIRLTSMKGLPSKMRILRLMTQLGYRATVRSFYDFLPLLKKGQDHDIYYCHFGPNGLRAVELKKAGIIRGQIVTVFHGYDITRLVEKHGKGYYASLFDYGDLFLTVSQRWKDRLIDLGCDPEKIVIHRLGVDPNRFRIANGRKRKGEPLRMLSIARLVEKKGIEYAIRALGQLDPHENLEYTVVGGGPLLEQLANVAKEVGVESCVRLLGPQPDERINDELQRADVFLAPSVTSSDGDQEGIPVAIMEAMAMGLPVVSTLHSGIPELVDDEVSGLLVPERDPAAVARSIKRLNHDADLRRKMGEEGRRIIESDYNLHTSNQRLFEILENLHKGQAGAHS